MQEAPFDRLELLVGSAGLERLRRAHCLVLGVGGVGSWAAEALARCAVGALTLVDFDSVKPSNINRQLPALHSTCGRLKVDVLSERLRDINPDIRVTGRTEHLTPENLPGLLAEQPWSFVIDAIDERPAKTAALAECVRQGLPVISSMGAARKRSTDGVEIRDISKTSGCPLARLIRKALRYQGIRTGIPVVCSPEAPEDAQAPLEPAPDDSPAGRRPLGTVVFPPAVFGLKCAEYVVSHLLNHP